MVGFLLSQCYEYFASGKNYFGQLGLNISDSHTMMFGMQTSLFEGELRFITAGNAHAFALTTANVLYGWGDNSNL